MLTLPNELLVEIYELSEEFNMMLTCKEMYNINIDRIFSTYTILEEVKRFKFKLNFKDSLFCVKLLLSVNKNIIFSISYDDYLLADQFHFLLRSIPIYYKRKSFPKEKYTEFITGCGTILAEIKKDHLLIYTGKTRNSEIRQLYFRVSYES